MKEPEWLGRLARISRAYERGKADARVQAIAETRGMAVAEREAYWSGWRAGERQWKGQRISGAG